MYQAFQTRKHYCIALEYCPGGDLYTHLHMSESFSEEKISFYASQLVLALEYLHSQNIIFREYLFILFQFKTIKHSHRQRWILETNWLWNVQVQNLIWQGENIFNLWNFRIYCPLDSWRTRTWKSLWLVDTWMLPLWDGSSNFTLLFRWQKWNVR